MVREAGEEMPEIERFQFLGRVKEVVGSKESKEFRWMSYCGAIGRRKGLLSLKYQAM